MTKTAEIRKNEAAVQEVKEGVKSYLDSKDLRYTRLYVNKRIKKTVLKFYGICGEKNVKAVGRLKRICQALQAGGIADAEVLKAGPSFYHNRTCSLFIPVPIDMETFDIDAANAFFERKKVKGVEKMKSSKKSVVLTEVQITDTLFNFLHECDGDVLSDLFSKAFGVDCIATGDGYEVKPNSDYCGGLGALLPVE